MMTIISLTVITLFAPGVSANTWTEIVLYICTPSHKNILINHILCEETCVEMCLCTKICFHTGDK